MTTPPEVIMVAITLSGTAYTFVRSFTKITLASDSQTRINEEIMEELKELRKSVNKNTLEIEVAKAKND